MVRKIKRIFIFSTALIIPTISLPYTTINNSLTNASYNKTTLNDAQLLTNNINSLKYPTAGDANNNITHHGIFRIVNSDSQKKIVMSGYNSNVIWDYNLLNNPLLRQIYTNYRLKTIYTKYNPYMDTIFVYGHATNDLNASDKPYLFQVNASNGTSYLVNNSNASSILTNSNGLPAKIDSLIFDKEEATFIAFDSSQDYKTINNLTKISYKNYSSLVVNAQYIKNFAQDTPINGKAVRATKIIKAVNLYDGFFGLYKYYEDSKEGTQPAITEKKIAFSIFDWQLRKLSTDVVVYNESSGGGTNVAAIIKDNANNFINDSFVIPQSNGMFRISLNMIEPLMSGFYNQSATNFGFSNKLRYVEFTPPTSGSPSSLTLKEVPINGSNHIGSLKLDAGNNKIYAVTYADPSKLNTPKLFSIDTSTMNAIEVTGFNNSLSTTSTLVNVFPLHSSENLDKQKTYLVKQVVNFENTNNSNITSSTTISGHKYYSSDVTGNGTSYTENNQKELYESAINDVQDALSKSELIKKLPTDISESDILNLTKLMVNGTENTEMLQSKTLLPVPNTNNELVADNGNGTLRVNIEVKVKNWWNPTSSFVILRKDIQLTGFSKTLDLQFKLITKETDDPTKWKQIVELKKKLPSEVTQQDIIDSFTKFGEKLGLKAENVKIYNTKVNALEGETTPAKTYINVFANDSNGTLRITYDLTEISSPSIEQENLTGSSIYDGFVKTSKWTQVTINDNIFKQFKNKLPYQITKQEIISSLNFGSAYKASPEYWTLTFDDEFGSDQYIQNIIDGKINFTIKYNRELDTTVPSTVTDNILTVAVKTSNVSGSGFMKFSDYMEENIYLDANLADVKTSSLKLEEVTANLNSILDQTIIVSNNWVDPSKIYTVTQKEATTNSVTYNLALKSEFPSNIQVVDAEGKVQNLIINNQWITKLNTIKPNYFTGVSEIKYNINLIDFDWNYASISKDNSTISIQNLYQESNAADRGYDYRFLLPSDFIDSFETDPIKGKIGFQNTFGLIKPYATNPTRSTYLTSNRTTRNIDPGYYEIDKVTLVPNNQLGTVIANYVIRYPNLQTAYGNPVLLYPTIKITGMKTQGIVSIDYATIITSALVVLIVIAIGALILIRIRRNKFLGKDLRNKYDEGVRNKIIATGDNDNEVFKPVKKQESKVSKIINIDKSKEVRKKNVDQTIDFSKFE